MLCTINCGRHIFFINGRREKGKKILGGPWVGSNRNPQKSYSPTFLRLDLDHSATDVNLQLCIVSPTPNFGKFRARQPLICERHNLTLTLFVILSTNFLHVFISQFRILYKLHGRSSGARGNGGRHAPPRLIVFARAIPMFRVWKISRVLL